MKEKLLWDLFCKTGKIEYYLKYKEQRKGKQDETRSWKNL
jgi:hypothetical protein